MNIWIISKSSSQTPYSIQRFIDEAKKLDIQITIIHPSACSIVVGVNKESCIFLNGERIVDLPDCIIPRMGSGTTYEALAILREFERMGLYILNSAASIQLAKDKLASLQRLSEESLPIPKTMLASFPLHIPFISKHFRFPVVFKRLEGSQGKGIVLCKNKSQLEDVTDFVDTSANFLIQEYIKEAKGSDIRVLVIGGRPIGAMRRKAPRGSFKANFSRGGTVEAVELTPTIEWIAVEAARIIGLDCAGIDLLQRDDGFLICEVNSSPGFEGFEEATGANVPRTLFDFLQVRLGGHR